MEIKVGTCQADSLTLLFSSSYKINIR